MAKFQKPATIGPYTQISFPQLGIKNVSAKIDTGAESSSVWASNIKERHGMLTFSLFDADSPFYTGEELSTKDYEIRLIKNSFGHTEFRYKAKLKVSIEGRVISVKFTLANRSTNTFPVLIGRRTLQGRFLVDVSKDSLNKKMSILIINSEAAQPSQSKKFFQSIEKTNKKIHLAFTTYNDLAFLIDGEKNTKVSVISAEKDIASYDLVYFKSVRTNKDVAAAAAQYLKNHGVDFIDKAALNYQQSLNKLYQYMILDGSNIKIPKSVYLPSSEIKDYYDLLVNSLGLPFVLKDIRGKKGLKVYLINNKKDFDKACRQAKTASIELIAQKFIPHEGHYRMLILGKRLELVVYREHKLSQNRLKDPDYRAESELVHEGTLPGTVRKMSILAAEKMSLDVAGVDVIQDAQSKSWYCLEVNDSPQLVTGSFIEEKEQAFSEYLSKQLKSKL